MDSDCTKDNYCDTATNKCVSDIHTCNSLTDAGPPSAANTCCPGQKCNANISQCTDVYTTPCTTDSDCTTPGQYCEMALGVYPKGPGCTFHKCGDGGTCDSGLSCFDSYCVAGPPCGGGCAPGSVCTPVNNFCFQPQNPSAQCMQSCGPGTELVFTNGLNVFDHCDFAEEADCTCEPFPNLTTNDGARFSQAALTSSQVLVSAYDGQYGDLILHTYDRNTLQEASGSPEWIDGVPAMGTITGNTMGGRNGISTPGPDVGRYTSIAVDPSSKATHISYYSVATDGSQNVPVASAMPLQNLSYARRVGTGAWTVIKVVDGQDSSGTDTGDVGMYSHITLAPDGSPVIAYFQRSGVSANAAQTALKVARATTPTPASASDWTIVTVDTGTRTLPPCGGMTCPSGKACVATAAAPNGACTTTSGMCAGADGGSACGSSQTCVIETSAPVCDTTLTASTLVNLPEGNGLMPSITYVGNVPVVVWYDHANGQLKGVIATSDSAAHGPVFDSTKIMVLDDGTAAGGTGKAHDVGRFPSVAVGPSQQIAVTYFDATAQQTLLLTAKSDWTNMTPPGSMRVIDNGSGAASPYKDTVLFVGANSSVQFVNGKIEVVYQDATGETLRLATQASPTGPVAFSKVLAQTGAGGFYASLAADGSGAYASHATIYAVNATTPNNQLQVVKLP
jgi:hypothetical protein